MLVGKKLTYNLIGDVQETRFEFEKFAAYVLNLLPVGGLLLVSNWCWRCNQYFVSEINREVVGKQLGVFVAELFWLIFTWLRLFLFDESGV